MIAGPQIISSFFLATSSDAVKSSLGFLAGAALSITTVVTVTYVIAQGATGDSGGGSSGTADTVIDWIILGPVLFLSALHPIALRKAIRQSQWLLLAECWQVQFMPSFLIRTRVTTLPDAKAPQRRPKCPEALAFPKWADRTRPGRWR